MNSFTKGQRSRPRAVRAVGGIPSVQRGVFRQKDPTNEPIP